MPIDKRTGKSYPDYEGVGDLTGPPELTKTKKLEKPKKLFADKVTNPEPVKPVSTDTSKMGMKKGGSVGSASKRADGCAQRGKTRGKML